MPTLLLPRQTTSPSPVSSSTSSSNGGHSGMPSGEIVGAILVPIILVVALMTVFIVSRRRRRTNRPRPSTQGGSNEESNNTSMSQRFDGWLYVLHQAFNQPQSTTTLISAHRNPNDQAVAPATSAANGTEARRGRRGRRDRVRRTDSGATVKTLPEYDELREDEILLYKAENEPQPSGESLEEAIVEQQQSNVGSRRSSRNGRRSSRQRTATQTSDVEGLRNQSVSPSRAEGGSVRRQSSLGGMAAEGLSALRRLSLRRDHANTEGAEEESNEMDNMLPHEVVSSPVATIVEEPIAYDHLYPTLPPQIQVQNTDGNVGTATERRGGGGGFRNLFRSNPDPAASHRRVSSANPSTGDLSLTPTRSSEQSFYRPSISSSRRVFGGFLNNGSSASLLSQNGVEGSDSPGRASFNSIRHTRNISAPISTRRLQFAPPVAGFSDKQMQFLTSVDSLDKYSIPVADGSTSFDTERLPAFEEDARNEESTIPVESRRLAPLLTTAEVQARQEQSPTTALPLPGSQVTEADTAASTSTEVSNITTTISS